jgi:sulfur-carrier protein
MIHRSGSDGNRNPRQMAEQLWVGQACTLARHCIALTMKPAFCAASLAEFLFMPRVVVGSALTRWLDSSQATRGERAFEVSGETLREALESLFAREPQLRGYVLDELGAVRNHVALFLDGSPVYDRKELQSPLAAHSELYILQALSGG